MVVGVVHNPILKETYTATLGGGAYKNDEAIKVSGETELRKALLATEIGTLRDNESVTAIFQRICAVVEPSRSIRQCGSCAMNMVGVACGRLDAMFEIGFGGPWDCAAGLLSNTDVFVSRGVSGMKTSE
jgi:inositol-phosphate phosphatase/L-galactose 1-phosphate phosphatase